jgi:hypothetical protein
MKLIPFSLLLTKVSSAIFLMVLSTPRVYAQKWEAAILLGSGVYSGETNPNLSLKPASPQVGISGSYYFNGTWAARATSQFSRFQTSDLNKNFPKDIISFSGLADFHFFEFLQQRSRLIYTPYLFSGITVVYEPFSGPVNVGIPVGAGFKMNLKSKWSLGFEMSYNSLFTDQFDSSHQSSSQQNDGYFSAQLVISRLLYKGRCPQWR